jgi:flagellar biosynthesis GTPase FlhF
MNRSNAQSETIDRPSVYRGATLEELLPRIREELGPEAVITRQREGLAGGLGGFFQRQFVEVEAVAAPPAPATDFVVGAEDDDEEARVLLAGLEDDFASVLARTEPEPEPQLDDAEALLVERRRLHEQRLEEARRTAEVERRIAVERHQEEQLRADDERRLAAARRRAEQRRGAEERRAAVQQRLADERRDADERRTAEIARLVAERRAQEAAAVVAEPPATVAEEAAAVVAEPAAQPVVATPAEPAAALSLDPPAPPATVAAPAAAPVAALSLDPPAPPAKGRTSAAVAHERALVEHGLPAELAQAVVLEAVSHELPFVAGRQVKRAVRRALARRIPVRSGLGSRRRVAIVGAGGSGKTAVAGALAVGYATGSDLTVHCVTLDAPDGGVALRGRLRGTTVGVQSVTSPGKPAGAGEVGVLIVDTPAVTPRDPAAVERLATALKRLGVDEVLVALPATIGAGAARELVRDLAGLAPAGLVLTHADATGQLGTAVGLAIETGLALAYVARHPDRPAALAPADPEALAAEVLP